MLEAIAKLINDAFKPYCEPSKITYKTFVLIAGVIVLGSIVL